MIGGRYSGWFTLVMVWFVTLAAVTIGLGQGIQAENETEATIEWHGETQNVTIGTEEENMSMGNGTADDQPENRFVEFLEEHTPTTDSPGWMERGAENMAETFYTTGMAYGFGMAGAVSSWAYANQAALEPSVPLIDALLTLAAIVPVVALIGVSLMRVRRLAGR